MTPEEQTYWAIHNSIISMTPEEACKLKLHSALYRAGKKVRKWAKSNDEVTK